MIHYPKFLLPLMLSLAACNTTNETVSVQAPSEASVAPKEISKAITLHDVGGLVLSRLRSGPSTHLCDLSLKSQGAFAT